MIADEMNPARVAALRLGMGERMVAFTVQINCGSGMQSLDSGLSLHPKAGKADLILAGGAEALSYAPLVFPQSGVRWFAKFATAKRTTGEARRIPENRPSYFNPISGLNAVSLIR